MALKKVKKIIETNKVQKINENEEASNKPIEIDSKGKDLMDVSSLETIKIESINRNIDTNKYSAKLRFLFRGNIHKLEIPRGSYLTRKEIIKFQDYGLEVTERNAEMIIRHLAFEEKNAPVLLVHSNLGFDILDGKPIFKHFNCINVPSSYNGELDIIPKGTKEKWYEAIRNHVIDNIPLETMLVVGFSSAIVGVLGKYTNFESLLVHLSGESTTGKTTASMLAVSPWGNPNEKIPNGLARTWNTSENNMFTNLVGNNGLAVVFDEISMNDSLDFTKFIYKFVGNKDKGRLNSESKAEKVGTWCSTIISNGEFSLLEKAKKNTGAKIRVIDFYNVPWTKSAKSADELQEVLFNNYGYAGIEFVKKLLKNDAEEILDEIKLYQQHTIEQMKDKGIDDKFLVRRAWKYTVIMYTALKVKELLGINLHTDEIWDFLMENEKQSLNTRDLYKNAFEYFIEYVNVNFKKFLRSDSLEATNDNDVKNPTFDIMGKINILPNKPFNEICIYPNIFNKVMKEAGFEDPKIILKNWKDTGILDAESDRFTRKRKLIENAGTISVHVIRVSKDELNNKTESNVA